jgi:hypothetical protein
MIYLWVSYKKKYEENFFFITSAKSLKKGVVSASVSQRYRSGDPDPHKNVTDPQHCSQVCLDPDSHFIHIRKIRKHFHVIGGFWRLEIEKMKAAEAHNSGVKAQN